MVRQSIENIPTVCAHRAPHNLSSSVLNTPVIPTRSSSPEKMTPLTSDTSSLLTVLASQERLVLELRENLHRAEHDLAKLKKQLVVHEAARRRSERRHVAQLQPLNTFSTGSREVDDEELSRTSREQEAQRITSIDRTQSQRKVFSGSRHMKTLSLLSPTTTANYKTHQSPKIEPRKYTPKRSEKPSMPNIAPGVDLVADHTTTSKAVLGSANPSIPEDAILDTGKQLVGDFRQGLWTFFEDLRQATVGEEAINGSKSTTVEGNQRV